MKMSKQIVHELPKIKYLSPICCHWPVFRHAEGKETKIALKINPLCCKKLSTWSLFRLLVSMSNFGIGLARWPHRRTWLIQMRKNEYRKRQEEGHVVVWSAYRFMLYMTVLVDVHWQTRWYYSKHVVLLYDEEINRESEIPECIWWSDTGFLAIHNPSCISPWYDGPILPNDLHLTSAKKRNISFSLSNTHTTEYNT